MRIIFWVVPLLFLCTHSNASLVTCHQLADVEPGESYLCVETVNFKRNQFRLSEVHRSEKFGNEPSYCLLMTHECQLKSRAKALKQNEDLFACVDAQSRKFSVQFSGSRSFAEQQENGFMKWGKDGERAYGTPHKNRLEEVITHYWEIFRDEAHLFCKDS